MSSTVRWVCHVLDACRERRWRAGLVLADIPTDKQVCDALRERDCRIYQIPRPACTAFDLHTMWTAYRILHETQWTVLHVHNICTPPLMAGALAHVPVRIWQRHDFSSQTKANNNVVRGWIPPSLWTASRLATRIHAVSAAAADELIQYGVPADRVYVWPNKIEVATFRDAVATDLRTEFGISPEATVVTTVGSVIPRKGIDILLRAVGRVSTPDRPMAVIIVGDGPPDYVAAMRQLADAEAGASTVHFVGVRSDVPGILKASDVFVLASRSEAFGYAMAEALAAGVACIGARVGGIPEFVADGVNGLLFRRNSVADLARRLELLVQDRQLRRRLAHTAAASADRLDLNKQINELMDVYERALRG